MNQERVGFRKLSYLSIKQYLRHRYPFFDLSKFDLKWGARCSLTVRDLPPNTDSGRYSLKSPKYLRLERALISLFHELRSITAVDQLIIGVCEGNCWVTEAQISYCSDDRWFAKYQQLFLNRFKIPLYFRGGIIYKATDPQLAEDIEFLLSANIRNRSHGNVFLLVGQIPLVVYIDHHMEYVIFGRSKRVLQRIINTLRKERSVKVSFRKAGHSILGHSSHRRHAR